MGKYSHCGFVESTTVIIGVFLFSLLAFGGALTISNKCELAKTLDKASKSDDFTFTQKFCEGGDVGFFEITEKTNVSAQPSLAEKGDRGERGEKGDKGDTGAIGATGETGAIGATGPAGPTGVPGTSGTAGGWGDITGTLTDQTDLQSALDDKQDLLLSNNISQWTNDALYITDGNTGWDNSYGLITASDAVTGLVQSTAIGSSYFTGGNVGIGITNPAFKLELAGTSGLADRKMGINGTQVLYLPDQTSFTGSLVLGNGGNNLTNTIDTNGWYNTLIGIGAGTALTTGQSNTAIGYQALTSANNDSWNTAVGRYSLTALTSGTNNIAIGNDSGRYLVSGGTNIFIGDSSGNSTVTGSDDNIFIGYQTGWSANNAFGNVVVGSYAFEGASGSSENTMIGNAAGADSTGSYNTMIGPLAGRYTTGNNNIYLGYRAGDNVYAGENNIIIGHDINASSATSSNQLVIGNLIFGTGIDGTGNTLSSGNIGIGTTAPTNKLQVSVASGENLGLFYSANDTAYLRVQGNTRVMRIGTDDLLGPQFGYEGHGGFSFPDAGDIIPWSGDGTINLGRSATYRFGNFYGMLAHFSGSGNNYFEGNVGIGTTAPASRLHVVGGASGTVAMEVRGNSSNNANIQEWKYNNGTLLTAITNEGFLDLSSSGLPNTFNLALKVNNSIVGASEVAGGLGNGIIRVGPSGRSLFNFITDSDVNSLFSGGVANEGYRRFAISGGGMWQVGSGTTNVDTFLTRLSGGGFEISTTTTDATSLTVQKITGQTGDYLNLTSVGGATGDVLTVDTSGNVGIGTTAPSELLDIVGNLELNGALKLRTNDGIYWNGSDASMYADSGDLFLIHNIVGGAFYLESQQGTLYLRADQTSANSKISFAREGGTELGYFITGATNTGDFSVDTNSLYVDASANSVGIGTSSIDAKLDVFASETGAIDRTGLRFQSTISSSGASTSRGLRAYAIADFASGTLTGLQGIQSTINASNGATVTYAENVALESFIDSSSQIDNLSMLKVNVPNNSGILVNLKGIEIAPLASAYSLGSSEFYAIYQAGTGDTSYFGGSVGIGTTNPQQKLHVYRGTDGAPVRFEDTNGYCEINPTSTTWTCTSDIRLKKDVEVIDNAEALRRITELEAVTFRWNKQDSTEQKNSGLIAQDVEKIFPEFVSTSETGMKSVAYGSFTPVLISAISAQQVQIEALQKVADKIVLSADDEEPLIFLSPIKSPELTTDSVKTKSLIVDGITFASEADIARVQTSFDALVGRLDSLETTLAEHSNVLAAMSADNQSVETLLNNELIKSLIAGGSIKITSDTEFEGATYFKSIAAFFDTVIFAGKPLYEDTDLAGYAEIPSGETSIHVVFDKPFRNTPVINLTPRDFIQNLVYRVHSESETGFVIAIDQPTFENVKFSWTAFPIKYIKNSLPSPTETPTPTPSPTIFQTEVTPTIPVSATPDVPTPSETTNPENPTLTPEATNTPYPTQIPN